MSGQVEQCVILAPIYCMHATGQGVISNLGSEAQSAPFVFSSNLIIANRNIMIKRPRLISDPYSNPFDTQKLIDKIDAKFEERFFI